MNFVATLRHYSQVSHYIYADIPKPKEKSRTLLALSMR